MTEKEQAVFIRHIIESIEKIEQFSRGISKESLKDDELRQYAIVRAIEIIGEAVKNLSKEFKEKHKDIPWREIIGTRDIMIHKYFGVDLEIVWDIIKHNLPDLKKKLKSIATDWNNWTGLSVAIFGKPKWKCAIISVPR